MIIIKNYLKLMEYIIITLISLLKIRNNKCGLGYENGKLFKMS